jgi:hypothetical protein
VLVANTNDRFAELLGRPREESKRPPPGQNCYVEFGRARGCGTAIACFARNSETKQVQLPIPYALLVSFSLSSLFAHRGFDLRRRPIGKREWRWGCGIGIS